MEVEVTCCACEDLPTVQPSVPWEEFTYCRPLQREAGIAATDCRPEAQEFEKPQPRVVLPRQCRPPQDWLP